MTQLEIKPLSYIRLDPPIEMQFIGVGKLGHSHAKKRRVPRRSGG